MIGLEDEMFLYHGSYTAIPEVDLSKCSQGLDFGQGFYLTTSFQQALEFIPSSVRKNTRRKILSEDFIIDDGQVSVYRFHQNPKMKIHLFPSADINWLHYIASNRSKGLFNELRISLEDFDIIGGKIADDSTATLLNGYISGDFGTPGTERTDSFTIGGLLPERLKDQFCFRTQLSLESLEFVRSERYGDNR